MGDIAASLPWWAWPLLLFAVTFLVGVIAVASGIGGGVLFVPIVGGLFPFHLDFVRGAGLLLALCGSLSAAPHLLRQGLASLRLMMPLALVGSVFSIVGALVGLALPTRVVQVSLGAVVLGIAALMFYTRNSTDAALTRGDAWARALGLSGTYVDPRSASETPWHAHRTGWGLASFAVIGLLGGLFGLGAGWANVPALNLLMGVPLKVAVGTSGLSITVMNTSAAWIYMNEGALLPMLHVPSILGIMLGARVGAKLLHHISTRTARGLVIGVLVLAGVRSLVQGLWP